MSKSRWLVLSILVGGLVTRAFGGDAKAEHSTGTEAVGGTVSVEELLNPLSGKALRTILNAQRDLRSGHRDRAMESLQQALDDPGARPYAVSILAVEHLKADQLDIAVEELEEAVHLLPGHAEIHSNLAYALGRTGQYQRALSEARQALQLDPAGAKTRLVLGWILLLHAETADEGVAYLKMIAPEFPDARRALATYDEWKGRADNAEREKQARRASSPSALGFQSPH